MTTKNINSCHEAKNTEWLNQVSNIPFAKAIRNENIKHKNPVKILKAISSLQDVFSATTLHYLIALRYEKNSSCRAKVSSD